MKYFICFSLLLSSLQGDEFEEGIELIKQREYVQAAEHFKHAADSGNSAAFFGKIACEVALGKHEKAAKHLNQIHQRASVACHKCDLDNIPPTTAKKPISAYDCRQRVRKVTKELRTLVERIVADTISGFFQKIRTFRQLNPYIDMLERNGLACCQNNQTVESCTEPLVEQLKLWNSEGLPVEHKQK